MAQIVPESMGAGVYLKGQGRLREESGIEWMSPQIPVSYHMAFFCSQSCPPVRLFCSDNIDSALELATRAFCQNDITIDVEKKLVKMTKILMWYGMDFGSDEKSILQ